MISFWLRLPAVEMLVALAFFFGAIAVCLVLFSFVLPTAPTIRSFRGVVAPFIGTIAVIFAILLGFLANDIWGREQRAAAAVRAEAENLTSLLGLAETFGLPADSLKIAVRGYADAVVTKELPSMEDGNSAPEADRALDRLLKTIARFDLSSAGNADFRRLLLNAGIAVSSARNERLRLSRDESEALKWLLVLVLAVACQITVAIVHLDTIRPQIAALSLLTASLIFVLGLLALYDAPFSPPLVVAPEPLVQVLSSLNGIKTAPEPAR